ncbi:hypothetical protein SISNIDRAFT_470966 [Sistotremastrum niveocremeum HHB9708]|uniref:Uncharacterized protein n=1 Tax=Sistotremastrum niveocremeum HHB9708 TaxID=1314777 RepID=A0A164N6E2_9AGAM|nr:hypothetical protein SISNIDRAFT_470966 [Sistotremastrum niveocremeum HHB9708]
MEEKPSVRTKQGLRDHIVELIVTNAQAMAFVERAAFRELLPVNALRLKIAESPISEVSGTFDGWTSPPGDPYMGLTVHRIDAPPELPQKWTLRMLLLAFRRNRAFLIQKILEDCGPIDLLAHVRNFRLNDQAMKPSNGLEIFGDVLEHPHAAQQAFLSEKEPTAWKTISIVELQTSIYAIGIGNSITGTCIIYFTSISTQMLQYLTLAARLWLLRAGKCDRSGGHGYGASFML